MATHSSNLAWKIPWAEELDGLYSPWSHKESDTTEHSVFGLLFSSKAYKYIDRLDAATTIAVEPDICGLGFAGSFILFLCFK